MFLLERPCGKKTKETQLFKERLASADEIFVYENLVKSQQSQMFNILWMEEIPNNHLTCMKPCQKWDIYQINSCRISSINSTLPCTLICLGFYLDWILLHSYWIILNHFVSCCIILCIHLESFGIVLNNLTFLNQSSYIHTESSFIHLLNLPWDAAPPSRKVKAYEGIPYEDWLHLEDPYCWWFRNPKQPPFGCFPNPINNGINYQPQLVIAGFLNHQQYHRILW